MSEVNLLSATQRLASLSPSAQRSIVEAVKICEPGLFLGTLVDRVKDQCDVDLESLREILGGFGAVSKTQSASPNFAESMGEFLSTYPEVNVEDRTQFAKVIAELLASGPLMLTAKAQNILWGQGNLFVEAKSITQMRPLFLQSTDSMSGHSVVVHEIFVTTEQDGNKKSVGMLMDSNHLHQMRGVLDRAIEKEKTIRADGRLTILSGDQFDDL